MKAAAAPVAGPFGRSQVEWALWRYMTNATATKPSKAFLLRVKLLLESDRSAPLARGRRLAFSDEPSAGQGNHGRFLAFDALVLYVALVLVDMGFKRLEVTLLMRNVRKQLREAVGPIIDARTEAYAKGVELFRDFDPQAEKNRVVLLLPRVEDAADYVSEEVEGDIWIAHGMNDLLRRMREMPLDRLILIEISGVAYMLPSLLHKAPIPKRGGVYT